MITNNLKIDANDSSNLVAGNHEIVLTVAQTTAILHISLPTLKKWEKAGILVPFKIGGRVFYKRRDIEDLFNREKGGAE